MHTVPTKQDVSYFILNLPSIKGQLAVRGRTQGSPITLETPLSDFFPRDMDAIDTMYGFPLVERFWLKDMGIERGILHNSYKGLGDQEDLFYRKYPRHELGTERDTLGRFVDQMYDLLRIKYKLELEWR